VVFSFGTNFGSNSPGTPGSTTSAPEPATLLLAGGSLCLLGLTRRRKRSS
jgi:hypothetical protein